MKEKLTINETDTDSELLRNFAIFQLEMMDRVIKLCEKGVNCVGDKLETIIVSPTVYQLLRSNVINLPKNKPVIYSGVRIKNKKNLLDNEIVFEAGL